jgi:hypothetical protein
MIEEEKVNMEKDIIPLNNIEENKIEYEIDMLKVVKDYDTENKINTLFNLFRILEINLGEDLMTDNLKRYFSIKG